MLTQRFHNAARQARERLHRLRLARTAVAQEVAAQALARATGKETTRTHTLTLAALQAQAELWRVMAKNALAALSQARRGCL